MRSVIMDVAIRQALRSGCRQRVGAVLAKGNRILTAAPNIRRNAPTIDYRHATFHAEESVLRRYHSAAGAVAYVARIGADSSAMMARPCVRCQHALVRAGVARVFYTASSTEVLSMSLSELRRNIERERPRLGRPSFR